MPNTACLPPHPLPPQTHVTPRLQQHNVRSASSLPPRQPSLLVRSQTLALRSSTSVARSQSRAGEKQGEDEEEPLEALEEEEVGAETSRRSVQLEWESVKDPPLNLRVTVAAEQIFLASTLAGKADFLHCSLYHYLLGFNDKATKQSSHE